MNINYDDITSKISDPPIWWDANGVPRYCEFSPKLCNIYADEAVLVLICCQMCKTEFKVAFYSNSFTRLKSSKFLNKELNEIPLLKDRILDGTIHYGDPPNIRCCPSGPSSNCLDLKVLEYWKEEDNDWIRDETLEIDLPDNVL